MNDTRPDLDALIEQGKNMATLDRYELIGWRVDITAALAAERERADALALIIEQAPHDSSQCDFSFFAELDCSCWKSDAQSAALVAAHDAEVKAQAFEEAATAIAIQRDETNPDRSPEEGWGVVDHREGRFLGKTVAVRLLRTRAKAIREGRSEWL